MADIKFVIDVDGVEKVVKLRTETDKVKTSAKTAGDKLDGLSRKVGRFGNTTNGARKNTNRMNAAIQNAGYQFGDFFVQVQSGQNALVAFSQQGTQLLGILPGVAGAVGGLAVVLGTQLLMAVDRNIGFFKTFAERVEGAEEALEQFLDTSERVAKGFREELGPEIEAFYGTLLSRDAVKAAREASETIEGLLKSTSDLSRSSAFQGLKADIFYKLGLKGSQAEVEDSLRQLGEVRRELFFLQGVDPTNVDDLRKGLQGIEKILASDIRRELDMSEKNIEKLRDLSVAWANALEQLTPEVEETSEKLADQSEELERILDYSEKLLAVDKERLSLASSIEEIFARTARQAKLMQEGMDRGVAGQVASMEMRIAKERELLIQLENAGMVSPGTTLSTSVTRQQQLEQYTADLTGMAAKKATTGTEQLDDAADALTEYGKKLDQIRLQVSGEFAGTMIDAFREVADGTKTVGQAFGDMAEQIIRQILDLLIYQPLLQALTNALLPGMGSSVFGAATQALAGPKPLPGVPAGGSVRGSYKFANGGIVNSPTMFGMSGGRTGLMGEAGPEAILPLKRGAGGKLGVEGGGNVTVNQNFNFAANGDESVKRIIAEAAPGIAKMTEAQIVNSRQRGGQMRRVFS